MSAAGRSNLHECELALIAGMFFQTALDRPKALRNSLCVIHAIDPNPHERRFYSQGVHQCGALEIVGRTILALGRLIIGKVHADWKGPHYGPMVLSRHGK